MKLTILGLVLVIVLTNAWWLYRSVDHGVTDMYRTQVCTEHEEALAQALAVIKVAKGRKARNDILQAARTALPQFGEPLDKEGEVTVGRLAFKFDQYGALVDVRAP